MLIVGIIAIGVSIIMALLRVSLGATAFDRVLGVNSIGTLIILGIALHGFIMGRPEFIDISILYAVLNFIGTLAVLKLFSTGALGDE
ncbi:MAG: monovalent cation/H+ antiporter complex subunit F [Candidatus Puniceispirillales bacterium WSBS_2018_MAG_OTU23]